MADVKLNPMETNQEPGGDFDAVIVGAFADYMLH
jgi:hypothetical protein